MLNQALDIFIINVIQIITFDMNPTLTNVTRGCTVFDIIITYFTVESYITIGKNTHLVSMLIQIWLCENSYCKYNSLSCYENMLCISMWTRHRYHEKLIIIKYFLKWHMLWFIEKFFWEHHHIQLRQISKRWLRGSWTWR